MASITATKSLPTSPIRNQATGSPLHSPLKASVTWATVADAVNGALQHRGRPRTASLSTVCDAHDGAESPLLGCRLPEAADAAPPLVTTHSASMTPPGAITNASMSFAPRDGPATGGAGGPFLDVGPSLALPVPRSLNLKADISVSPSLAMVSVSGAYEADGHLAATVRPPAAAKACAADANADVDPDASALDDLFGESMSGCRRLGRGAFGSVYLMTAPDGTPFARKTVQLSTDDSKRQLLRTELRIARRLRELDAAAFPHALRVHAVAVRPTAALIDMEYMDAGHAGRLAPLAEPALAALTRQLCAGLRVLHEELRVVHRDIKPENVLLASGGAAKLADFGVAALLEAGEDSVTDQQGSIMQMAPERLRGEAHGFASDVWALGVTVAQLATGTHPFAPADGSALPAGATERFWALAEVIKHTASGAECEAATRAAVARSLEASSAELRSFVDACTATEPTARPTAAELLQHPFVNSTTLDETALATAVDMPQPAAASPRA